ncbi:glutamate 5-kinase, partial [Candidatus Sumerlaeota bacterium]|nr:glutamate 5-kinase [Candidatus Sumerlaeota bacterium]
AAKTACDAGVHTIIAGGKTAGILNQIFGGKFSGTYLPASREGAKISSHERWIGYGRSTKGNRLTLDHGAVDALLRKKTSLLPVGVTEVTGVFKPGDIVDICNPEGSSIARGLVNYSSEEIEKIKGHKTKEIEFILGYHNYDEVVHRDNLVIL